MYFRSLDRFDLVSREASLWSGSDDNSCINRPFLMPLEHPVLAGITKNNAIGAPCTCWNDKGCRLSRYLIFVTRHERMAE